MLRMGLGRGMRLWLWWGRGGWILWLRSGLVGGGEDCQEVEVEEGVEVVVVDEGGEEEEEVKAKL